MSNEGFVAGHVKLRCLQFFQIFEMAILTNPATVVPKTAKRFADPTLEIGDG